MRQAHRRIDDPSDERMRESYLSEFPGRHKIVITVPRLPKTRCRGMGWG
jgi:hypothetical protein